MALHLERVLHGLTLFTSRHGWLHTRPQDLCHTFAHSGVVVWISYMVRAFGPRQRRAIHNQKFLGWLAWGFAFG